MMGTPVQVVQKFHRGDVVRIADPLPSYMIHFPGTGIEAIVIGSYHELCSQHSRASVRDRSQYSLLINGVGPVAWYDEQVLTLVRERNVDEVYVRRSALEEVSDGEVQGR